ncbi:MAG: YlmC/YmxH family sporulation protein [Lachnospiraceae bacterium]|nr:YlmC/YmxH family sporulation protein [Lachnospiraceae bacterium]
MTFSDLKCKDVINIKDCKCMGRICDLEFDDCSGHIKAIIVGNRSMFNSFLFHSEPETVIPWRDIVKIGPDIVLVEIGKGRL